MLAGVSVSIREDPAGKCMTMSLVHVVAVCASYLCLAVMPAAQAAEDMTTEKSRASAPLRLDLPPNAMTQPRQAQAAPALPEQASEITIAQLAQYVRMTLDRHPQLLQSEAKSRAADYRAKEASRNRYPKIVVSGDAGKERRDRSAASVEDYNQATAQLRVVVPLYNPETNARLEQRDSASVTAGWQLTDTREQLVLQTIEAYVGLLRASHHLALVQQSLKQHRQYVARLKEVLQTAPSRGEDLPLATARVARAESMQALYLRKLENARSTWWKLTGLSAPSRVADVPFARLPDTLDGALEEAYRQNAIVHLAQADIQLARTGATVSQASYQPKVNLEMRSRTGNAWDGMQGHQSRHYAGLTFEWQVFDGFAGTYANKAAQEEVLAAQYAYDDVRQALRVRIEQEWFDLQSNDVALQSYLAYVQNAQKMVEVGQRRLTGGQSPLLAVLDAENELLSARLSVENTQLDMVLASWRLLALQGRIQSILDQ